MYDWLQKLQHEKNVPTPEQLSLLEKIKDRVLVEFMVSKEGMLRIDSEKSMKEQPLLVFAMVHLEQEKARQ